VYIQVQIPNLLRKGAHMLTVAYYANG